MHPSERSVHCRGGEPSTWRVHDKRGRCRPGRHAVFFRGAETHSRSVLKAISWRALGTSDTFAISWFTTGRAEIAGSIAAMEIFTKVSLYYPHERIWALVPWGRRPPTP